MNKKMMPIISALTIMLFLADAVAAQTVTLPGSGWWFGVQVQNVGKAETTIAVTAYNSSNPSNSYTSEQVVGPGAAYTFTPINEFPGMPTQFQGAIVASADEPIQAIVNVTTRLSGGAGIVGGKAAAQYQSIDASGVATTVYFPLAKANHYNLSTTFYVQNAGQAPTDAVAVFRMRNGDVHTMTLPMMSVNQMVAFRLADAPTFNNTLPITSDGRVGGLVVTANQPLAGAVMEHFTVENPATVLQSTRGFTAADFDTHAYAPVVKRSRFGRFTGIQVQNVDSVPITVTVTYKGTAGVCNGNTYTDTQPSILPNTSHTFVQYEGRTNLAPDCTASAFVVSTGNIVAIANEMFRSDSVPTTGQAGITSFAIPGHIATTKISVPLFKDDRYSNRTGLQIQNVSLTNDAHVEATFSCRGAMTFTAISTVQIIRPGSAILFHTPSDDNDRQFTSSNPFLSKNVNCAVIVTSSDERIVALVNETFVPFNQGGTLVMDDNNYEGFNLAP